MRRRWIFGALIGVMGACSSDETSTDGGTDATTLDASSDVTQDAPPDTSETSVPVDCSKDSDGDGLTDAVEGRCADGGAIDTDNDGTPDYLDLDSDGDGVPDSCEKAVDTDGDGIPDFRDRDSDGDLLRDGDEDANGNCVVDTNETSRLNADTDGDGVGDLIETALGPGLATDPQKTPAKAGKAYFIETYASDAGAPPQPTAGMFGFSATSDASVPASMDIHTVAVGTSFTLDGGSPIDPVAVFLAKSEPSPSGGTDAVTGAACVTFSPSALTDAFVWPNADAGADGINDTVRNAVKGSVYCFNVAAKPNAKVPAQASAQVYTANLALFGADGGTYALGAPRTIYFVVPPAPP